MMPGAEGPRDSRRGTDDRRGTPVDDKGFTVRLPRSKFTPAMLRSLIGDIAPGCRATEVVQLLGTEVVTNALIHAPEGAADRITVTAVLSPPLLHLEVTGEGEFRESDVEDRKTGGYGLALVERLSESWGVRRFASGVTVWFTVSGFPTEA